MLGRFDPLHMCQGLPPPILLGASFPVHLSWWSRGACGAPTPGLLGRQGEPGPVVPQLLGSWGERG